MPQRWLGCRIIVIAVTVTITAAMTSSHQRQLKASPCAVTPMTTTHSRTVAIHIATLRQLAIGCSSLMRAKVEAVRGVPQLPRRRTFDGYGDS